MAEAATVETTTEPTAPGAAPGLLPGQPAPTETKAPAAPTKGSLLTDKAAPAPEAPTVAPRPEHIPEKFWDAKTGQARVEDLAKSYSHLESKFGAFKGAPAADEKTGEVRYALNLPEGLEGIDQAEMADDPFWLRMQSAAAELNMSQEGMDRLAGEFFAFQADSNRVNRESEMTRLRFSGWSDAKLADLAKFWREQADTDEQFGDVQALCTTAEGVLTLNWVRNKMLGTKMLPTEGAQVAATDPSVKLDQLMTKMQSLRSGSPEYEATRREIEATAKAISGER